MATVIPDRTRCSDDFDGEQAGGQASAVQRFAERVGQGGVAQERGGTQRAEVGMWPARQGFDTDDLFGGQVDFGPVDDVELPVVDGVT